MNPLEVQFGSIEKVQINFPNKVTVQGIGDTKFSVVHKDTQSNKEILKPHKMVTTE